MIPDFNYAPFVWASYAIAAVIIGWQMIQPSLAHRALVRELREDHLAEQLEQANDA